MATMGGAPEPPKIHRFPQSKYVDAVRWLPPVSAFDRFVVVAYFDADAGSASVELQALNPSASPTLQVQASWTPPSRISSLRTSRTHANPLLAAATFSGSLHVIQCNPFGDPAFTSGASVADTRFHSGPVAALDMRNGGAECVTVGEDGRVNLVSLVGDSSRLSYDKVFDANGLQGYTAVKWASPTEFVTGGYGFGLQWWDQRKKGGPVALFKGIRPQARTCGMVHSLDIHFSRKHICLAGGSSGTVFAWDLRAQNKPIVLSGVRDGEIATNSLSEGEVWEVQYDSYMRSSNTGNIASSKILPVMICSEDGMLAVVEQGEESIELLAEPCAINSFDIDQQNPSDVICSLEWETLAILARG